MSHPVDARRTQRTTVVVAALMAGALAACGGSGAAPESTAPASTAPASTALASTVPASTVPASTVPASTVPASTVPATTAAAPSSTPTTPATAGPSPVGLSTHTITVGQVSRTYLVHVPAQPGSPRAAVLVLHGGGGEGLGVADAGEHPLSVFRTVADREGFVVVYPAGLPAADRQGLAGWVDCRADNAVSSGADDVGFLAALVERIGAEYALPASRIFMAGGSNGAQMTQAFAFHHPEMLGAVASSAGNLPETPLPGPCTDGPSQPIPILLLHATADTQMPYEGGCVANLGGGCRRGRVVSAEATRDRWLAVNGLAGVAPVETVVEIDPADGGAAHGFSFAGPAPVEWWRLDGAGHTVSSQTVLVGANPVTGIQNRDVEFAEQAWSFFEAVLPAP
jgi:polyhydroxybutyrate depolymerase